MRQHRRYPSNIVRYSRVEAYLSMSSWRYAYLEGQPNTSVWNNIAFVGILGFFKIIVIRPYFDLQATVGGQGRQLGTLEAPGHRLSQVPHTHVTVQRRSGRVGWRPESQL